MWIPNQYAALCLEEGVSPVDVWGRLYRALRRDSTLEACSTLVDYLQAQLRGNVKSNESPYDADELVEPRTDVSLIRHRTGILQHMEPPDAKIAPPAPAPNDVGLMDSDLQELIVSLSSGHITTAPSASEFAHTIGKRWSVNHSALMKYTL